jgi:hypothetical protein
LGALVLLVWAAAAAACYLLDNLQNSLDKERGRLFAARDLLPLIDQIQKQHP